MDGVVGCASRTLGNFLTLFSLPLSRLECCCCVPLVAASTKRFCLPGVVCAENEKAEGWRRMKVTCSALVAGIANVSLLQAVSLKLVDGSAPRQSHGPQQS